MPLFLSEEEYGRCKHDGAVVAMKADSFIRELYNQLDTVKAQADAASITTEQTCSLQEQKYVSLSSEFTNLQSQYSQLNSSLDQRLSELAQLQADKHQIHLQSIDKDGEIERLSMEASEFHKSKRQLLELLEQKDIEISEKNVTIKSYLDNIPTATSLRTYTGSLADEIHGLHRELRRQTRRQTRRIDQLAQRFDSFIAYQMDFNSALVQMFANCGLNSGPNQVQFPNPPMFPDYVSDLTDEEDAADAD